MVHNTTIFFCHETTSKLVLAKSTVTLGRRMKTDISILSRQINENTFYSGEPRCIDYKLPPRKLSIEMHTTSLLI